MFIDRKVNFVFKNPFLPINFVQFSVNLVWMANILAYWVILRHLHHYAKANELAYCVILRHLSHYTKANEQSYCIILRHLRHYATSNELAYCVTCITIQRQTRLLTASLASLCKGKWASLLRHFASLAPTLLGKVVLNVRTESRKRGREFFKFEKNYLKKFEIENFEFAVEAKMFFALANILIKQSIKVFYWFVLNCVSLGHTQANRSITFWVQSGTAILIWYLGYA